MDLDITKMIHFRKLASLSIRFSFILDDSVEFLSGEEFPHLKSIDLSGCHLLSDQSLQHLSTGKFVTIKLNYINTISEQRIFNLISQAQNLNFL